MLETPYVSAPPEKAKKSGRTAVDDLRDDLKHAHTELAKATEVVADLEDKEAGLKVELAEARVRNARLLQRIERLEEANSDVRHRAQELVALSAGLREEIMRLKGTVPDV